jgi:hypothetical protein
MARRIVLDPIVVPHIQPNPLLADEDAQRAALDAANDPSSLQETANAVPGPQRASTPTVNLAAVPLPELPTPAGYGPEMSDAALKAAQAQTADNLRGAQIQRGADSITRAFGGTVDDTAQSLERDAHLPVHQLLQRRAMLEFEDKRKREQEKELISKELEKPGSAYSQHAWGKFYQTPVGKRIIDASGGLEAVSKLPGNSIPGVGDSLNYLKFNREESADAWKKQHDQNEEHIHASEVQVGPGGMISDKHANDGQVAIYRQPDPKLIGRGSGMTTEELTPEAVKMWAENIRKGNPSPSLGRGAGNQLVRISNEAARGGPVDVGTNKALLHAGTTVLTDLSKQRANTHQAEETTKKNLQVFEGLLGTVPDTDIPALNQSARAFASRWKGSPQQAAFNTALVTARTEATRVLANGGKNISDTDKNELRHLLDDDATVGQYKAALGILYRDMSNRTQSADEEINAAQGRIRDIGKPSIDTSTDIKEPGQKPSVQAHPHDSRAVSWARGALTDPKATPRQHELAQQILKLNGVQ